MQSTMKHVFSAAEAIRVPEELTARASGPCLHELFEHQADLRPSAPALVCGHSVLTYAELDVRANQLAHYLRQRGVGPGSFVGLSLERSGRQITAILACLKAGAAYVPIDPSFPEERIRHIASEAGFAVMLTEQVFATRFSRLCEGAALIALDTNAGEIAKAPTTRLTTAEIGLTSEDISYVLYTSGTTGRPKGVAAEHRNVTHFVQAFNAVCTTTHEDRVFQGFALGFDGSVEEIWMAFSNGAALVVGTPETPRFGPDLARFLAASGVTYFSTVPTMLSTMTESIPSLRQLVVSGEVCPPELVARWAEKGCRMLNVYGPTECTVNTTAARCEPDKPVTIGKPIDGYTTHIFDADMNPVSQGEKGELFIGGPGLARGYLNQPELTARAFIHHNGKRLYRTGDLARINEDGDIEFFGRIDGQVKIRGFRVELAEIEAVLLEHQAFAGAVASVHQRESGPSIAAYTVLNDNAPPINRGEVLRALRVRLPAYMIPATLDVLAAFPRLDSGKVDRKCLPHPVTPLVEEAANDEPLTPLEARIAEAWARTFQMPQVGADQDFFLDLGGHSLLAAQTANRLRSIADIQIAVRDIYAHPTVRALAAYIEARRPASAEARRRLAAPNIPPNTPRRASFAFKTAQISTLIVLFLLFSLPAMVVVPKLADFIFGWATLIETIIFLTVLALVLWPVMLTIGIASKWIIIGRYREGAYPLWGSYYYRWWLVSRLQALSGAGAFIGTPLMPVYFRLMGAKVGRACALDTALCSAWDLISIGDDTSIGADTQFLGVRVENGHLIFGRVDIGSRCFVGLHACLGLNVKMEDGARLDDQSALPDGEHVGAGEARRGSPARPADVPVPEGEPLRHSWARLTAFTLAQFLAAALLGLVSSAPGVVLLLGFVYIGMHESWAAAVLLSLLATPLFVIFACLWIAFCKSLVMRRAEPGVYRLHGITDLRYWLAGGMMRATRGAMLTVFTTIYLPPWMRLLGARIGKFSEMSTIFAFVPDLLTAGDGSFFADGAILGGRRTHYGRFEVAETRVGKRSFVGNSAILPGGTGLGDGCLLGVLSSPAKPKGTARDGTDWLGSPGFCLSNRHKVAGFGDDVTYVPTRWLYAQRAVIDALRILFPALLGATLGWTSIVAVILINEWFGDLVMYALLLPLALTMTAIAVLAVVALKWGIMGRFKPVIVPLWCRYVWWNEMINGAYESVMAPVVGFFFGTPVASFLLRLLGCKIGRHCYIGTSLFSEFDLVRIGDHVALNGGAVIQNHLFEDRIMKSSYIDIRDNCTVGNMSVVLYDTRMGEGAVIGSMSLLMKGEVMPASSRWHGIPTVQA